MKILGFYSSGELKVKELLDFRLRTSLHAAFGFFSLLDKSHWDISVLNEEYCSLLSMLY